MRRRYKTKLTPIPRVNKAPGFISVRRLAAFTKRPCSIIYKYAKERNLNITFIKEMITPRDVCGVITQMYWVKGAQKYYFARISHPTFIGVKLMACQLGISRSELVGRAIKYITELITYSDFSQYVRPDKRTFTIFYCKTYNVTRAERMKIKALAYCYDITEANFVDWCIRFYIHNRGNFKELQADVSN